MTWNGSSSYADYLSSFRSSWCEYDLSAYPKMRFQLQASAAGKQVLQTLEAKVASELRPDYWLYLPEKYDIEKSKRWPLVLMGIAFTAIR